MLILKSLPWCLGPFDELAMLSFMETTRLSQHGVSDDPRDERLCFVVTPSYVWEAADLTSETCLAAAKLKCDVTNEISSDMSYKTPINASFGATSANAGQRSLTKGTKETRNDNVLRIVRLGTYLGTDA
ncbi:hypothetical protein TIFTF001_008296 [Ficus carica]|uniref:Uncharacterized protein n=1 Tax=Ficus carica TaxID=3494 RepID=A0AA88A4K0_FICCA|nr:hypothetical protein TIFTF001_008296 [Ficus carica]